MHHAPAGKTVIAVFGSSRPRPGTARYEEARRVGYVLAEDGHVVMTGGYGGVMEAVSRGAREAGGTTVGVTTAFMDPVNPRPNGYVDTEIKVPTYGERLLKLTESADGYVVMRGGSGTLAELFLTWELVKNGSLPRRPIVLYGEHWPVLIGGLAETLADELSFSSYLHLLSFATESGQVPALIRTAFARNGNGRR